MTPRLAAIGVVIPARDEADRVDRCLAAVTESVRDLRCRPDGAGLPVRIVVVVDGCRDRTLERVAQWPAVAPVVCTAGRVGAARSTGIDELLTMLHRADVPAAGTWIANTDADSEVPPGWLSTHADAARRGAAMMLGTVRPDPAELDGTAEHRWYRNHRLIDGHRHVHGANLGVRADWYRRVGGFPPVARQEDVALAAAVDAAGGRIERTGASPVLTSARLTGRAPGGMADYLRRLHSGLEGPLDAAG
ncbi:glycosyltransferase [Nakamurella sp.]|uniref:glycosyltransferase n=1 Tax=Nakamurella sp. TaxID=1869182 RepID=UPI003783FFB6